MKLSMDQMNLLKGWIVNKNYKNRYFETKIWENAISCNVVLLNLKITSFAATGDAKLHA